MKDILILGAGELGNEVIDAVWNHPHRGANSVTVFLRGDPSKDPSTANPARRKLASTLESKGISIIYGDIVGETEQSLIQVFAGYSHVVGCSGMTYPPGTQLKIARVVLAANVERYFPWQYGMDYDAIGRGSSQDLFNEQLDVRDLLRGQTKMDWVIISTGLFMSFLFEPAFGVVSEDKWTVTALGSWENEITVTTPRDIGKAVAEVLWVDERVQGVIHVAGETASYEQIAKHVEKAQRSEIKRELATVEQLEAELKADPSNGMKKYRATFAHGKGVAWPIDQTFNVQKGMRFCGISEFLSK